MEGLAQQFRTGSPHLHKSHAAGDASTWSRRSSSSVAEPTETAITRRGGDVSTRWSIRSSSPTGGTSGTANAYYGGDNDSGWSIGSSCSDERRPGDSVDRGRPLGNEFISSQPDVIQERVRELLHLQQQHALLTVQYQEEELKLKQKFLAISTPLLGERYKVVNTGNLDSPPPYEWSEGRSRGIPGFWQRAMENHPKISTYIKPHDMVLLSHILDIRLEYLEGDRIGFSLLFEFSENEFMKNKILRKTYTYHRPDPSGGFTNDVYGHEFTYGEMTSDEVGWKKGKNLAVRQGSSGKEKPEESFFTFFNMPTDELLLSLAADEEDVEFGKEELEDLYDWLVNEHYELGEAFKEQLIPYAVHWYTGEATLYEDPARDDDEDAADEEAHGAGFGARRIDSHDSVR